MAAGPASSTVIAVRRIVATVSPGHVLFENDRVRVLEYLDHPGDQTSPHTHPDSVMVTLGPR